MLGWWDGLEFDVGGGRWLLSDVPLVTRADVLSDGATHAAPTEVTPKLQRDFSKPEVSSSGVIVTSFNNVALQVSLDKEEQWTTLRFINVPMENTMSKVKKAGPSNKL